MSQSSYLQRLLFLSFLKYFPFPESEPATFFLLMQNLMSSYHSVSPLCLPAPGSSNACHLLSTQPILTSWPTVIQSVWVLQMTHSRVLCSLVLWGNFFQKVWVWEVVLCRWIWENPLLSFISHHLWISFSIYKSGIIETAHWAFPRHVGRLRTKLLTPLSSLKAECENLHATHWTRLHLNLCFHKSNMAFFGMDTECN